MNALEKNIGLVQQSVNENKQNLKNQKKQQQNLQQQLQQQLNEQQQLLKVPSKTLLGDNLVGSDGVSSRPQSANSMGHISLDSASRARPSTSLAQTMLDLSNGMEIRDMVKKIGQMELKLNNNESKSQKNITNLQRDIKQLQQV